MAVHGRSGLRRSQREAMREALDQIRVAKEQTGQAIASILYLRPDLDPADFAGMTLEELWEFVENLHSTVVTWLFPRCVEDDSPVPAFRWA